MLRLDTIVHPTDFSESSRFAWHMACALARDHGARLLLVHVKPASIVVFAEGPMPPDPVDEEELKTKLDAMQPTSPHLVVERYLIDGDPARAIVEFAERKGADMIVVGSHGRTGIPRMVMGSVAELIARRAACPVMIVKTPVKEEGRVTEPEAAMEPAVV
ncbi:MAG: universal stress protein [Gemmataceae bacterium]